MSPRTVRRGSRPVAPSNPDELTAQRRSRAHEELLEVRPREPAPFVILEVSNPLRQSRYRVFVPEYPAFEGMACECTDFGHRGLGTCKHIEAAREWLEQEPSLARPVPSPGVRAEVTRTWHDIDARLASLAVASGPESLRVRRPGSVLLKPSPFPF